MKNVIRSVVAVIVGFIVASIVMTVIEMMNGRLLYPELAKAAEGLTDREAIRSLMATAPVGALLVVVLGWVLGSIAGGFVAGCIVQRNLVRHALVLGGLLTLAGIATNLMMPPPLWFWLVTLVAFVPATLVAVRFVPPRTGAAGVPASA